MIKVLIVEDDPMVAQINKKYTESVGEFKVIGVCTNGEEALEKIKNDEIDLIILDIYMPKLDGIELLKKMRIQTSMINVIMVTAAQDTDKLNEVLTLGAVDYLIKPFEYERFKEALERVRMRYELLNKKNIMSQNDIDKITNQSKLNLQIELPKGLNRRTLERIRSFMKDHVDKYYTNEEIAKNLKLSRVTIRRYMEYMESSGEIMCDIEYGAIGRPSSRYIYKV
ncbi:response regulator [Clostridium aestuarii]|uniref:Transcriptional regulatory protein n=1 Tax=Clostridium aestuarii TaxID=338193 RepID=A0ABT4D556_9CLOT|nr:response regulator [Clostridium aestuarii]MCY6485168.1 response regulator [Clostridium aestuarii]